MCKDDYKRVMMVIIEMIWLMMLVIQIMMVMDKKVETHRRAR